MNILIDDENNWLEQNTQTLSIIENVIQATLEHEKLPLNMEISITFVDNNTIKQINSEHRNINEITDVLSFPQIEWEDSTDSLDEYEDPLTGDIMLGDIVISTQKAEEQAVAYGHSLEREIGFLVAHSMFHLLGYDHMSKEEEAVMFTKQEQVLQKLGLIR